jgi:hypothetical protein
MEFTIGDCLPQLLYFLWIRVTQVLRIQYRFIIVSLNTDLPYKSEAQPKNSGLIVLYTFA